MSENKRPVQPRTASQRPRPAAQGTRTASQAQRSRAAAARRRKKQQQQKQLMTLLIAAAAILIVVLLLVVIKPFGKKPVVNNTPTAPANTQSTSNGSGIFSDPGSDDTNYDGLNASEAGSIDVSDLNITPGLDEKRENILLLGTDQRLPYGHDPGRADAIQIISLNLSTGAVKLISFERGIMVPVPDHDIDLLTHAFRWAGPEYMLSLFRDFFLLDMAGYAQVDFESFIEIIDAMGGIDVELTEMEAWVIDKQYDYHRHLVEGVNHLDGELALKYCRLRSIDSNWHRIERQRTAIQAAMDKAKSLSLKELDALADTVLPLIHTNLTKEQISDLLLHSSRFLGKTADQMTVPLRIPGEPAHCDFQFEAERLQEFIYGAGAEK